MTADQAKGALRHNRGVLERTLERMRIVGGVIGIGGCLFAFTGTVPFDVIAAILGANIGINIAYMLHPSQWRNRSNLG